MTAGLLAGGLEGEAWVFDRIWGVERDELDAASVAWVALRTDP